VLDRLAVSIDEVLVEVPARRTTGLFSQLPEQRIGVAATNRARGKHGESNTVIDETNLGRLALVTCLLVKVVGRKADNFEALELGCEAAMAGACNGLW
jgi:hypothetical protein